MCVCLCAHVPQHICGNQKVIIGIDPFLCILETEL